MVGGARSETKDKRVTQSHTISSIINTSGTPGGGGGGNHLSCKTQIQKYKIQKIPQSKTQIQKYKIQKRQPQSIIHRENAEDGVEIIEAHNT